MSIWVLIFFSLFAVYLYLEAVAHCLSLKKIPHRLAVTGIRGKSSITRLIAAGLKAAGYRVMAKTTGSKPVIIHPDGRETEIKRMGRPSIIEQKRLVRLAAGQGVDFLVSEMMGIQPEYLEAESRKLLIPEIIIISNIRVDHIEFLGKSEGEVAARLSSCLRPGVKVYIPEEEVREEIIQACKKISAELKPVGKNEAATEILNQLPYAEFEPNLRLAMAVLEDYGVMDDRIKSGFQNVKPDFGHLRAWRIFLENGQTPFYFFSLFAANDPLSTEEALKLVGKRMDLNGFRVAGLLSLRADRADRTAQWLDYLMGLEKSPASFFRKLDILFLYGTGSSAVKRNLERKGGWPAGRIKLLNAEKPDRCFEEIVRQLRLTGGEQQNHPEIKTNLCSTMSEPSDSSCGLAAPKSDSNNSLSETGIVIIGIGNIVGFGQKLIDYLEREGNVLEL